MYRNLFVPPPLPPLCTPNFTQGHPTAPKAESIGRGSQPIKHKTQRKCPLRRFSFSRCQQINKAGNFLHGRAFQVKSHSRKSSWARYMSFATLCLHAVHVFGSIPGQLTANLSCFP